MTRARPEKGYYQWLSCGTLLDAFDVEENSCDSQGLYDWLTEGEERYFSKAIL